MKLDNAEYETKLSDIATKFRNSDTYFEQLSVEHKNLYNMAGKILSEVFNLLVRYRYSKEDEKVEIARKMHRILSACKGDA